MAVTFAQARALSAPGSKAKATHQVARRRPEGCRLMRAASVAITSVVARSFSDRPPALRGILPRTGRTGSKSQGAAAAITPSACGSSSIAAASISAVVTTGITRARAGYVTLTGPLTIVTSWPRARAAWAIDRAMRPLEALVRYRTSSM